jgi:hypothetical protein
VTLPLYPSFLRRQASALIDDMERTDPVRLAALRAAPLAILAEWPGLTVRWEDQPASRGNCSVDGWYSPDGTIHLVRRVNVERISFTACHELGHHLQRHHPEVALTLAEHDAEDPTRRLEDRICDTFASRVLIPDAALPDLGRLGPTAADVIATYEATGASRAACVVRLADELDHEGWVILATPTGEVLFAAAAHHEFRLQPGTQQPDDSLITIAGSRGHAQGLQSVTYPSGKTSPQFNTDAKIHDGYVFVVMSVGATPWSPGPVQNRDRWARPPEFECESASCGATFTRYDRRCSTCQQPYCPDCGRCRCSTSINNRICRVCWIQRPEAQMPLGETICKPCQEE